MKALTTGKQNFELIIKNNLLYVDKTRHVYALLRRGSLYFLSRPRRFGKSLLVSVLSEIFKGRKGLFEGLYIAEQTDYDWPVHPVLHFNFAKFGHHVTDFEALLKEDLKKRAATLGISLNSSNLSQQVEDLVTALFHQQGSVVFLVDEYDKPMIDFLTNTVQAKTNQEIIRNFFAPLKDLEYKGYIKFLFVTGVSKFSKVSIFSDLNNLTDLTIDPIGNDLLGITQQELEENFEPYLQEIATQLKLSRRILLQHIKEWYNGYSWDGATLLYNPYSLLNFFEKRRFTNYWFTSGTPTFLVEIIRNTGINPITLESNRFLELHFDNFSIERLDIYNLLFQTGYLTIKNVEFTAIGVEYALGYPNKEVKQSFVYNLMEAFTFQSFNIIGQALIHIQKALKKGQVEVFIDQLKILLSDVSYHLMPKRARPKNQETEEESKAKALKNFEAWEGYFQTIIYLITAFLGFSVQTEITKHKGRLDLVAETQNFLYIMEFKLEESAEDAIQQIKDRAYLTSYKNSPKTILLVGVNFSKEEKNVQHWIMEEWTRI